jgi:dephospho-CoA kinase
VAHQLMAPGEAVYQSIVATFGGGILAADQTISRPLLASLAFPNRIAELNAIVHPAVLLYEDNWMRQMAEADPYGVSICEAALLIEAGGVARYDRLIVVTCDLEKKVSRFAERTGTTEELAAVEVATRMAAQMPEAAKATLAHYVIENNGSKQALAKRVRAIWKELSRDAKSG